MKIRTISTGLVIAALLAALPMTSAWATHKSEAQQIISEAKVVREKAAAAGITSTDSAAMIAEAEELLNSRQYTRAAMIAGWAIRQDEFALQAAAGGAPADDKSAVAKAMIASAEQAQAKAAEVGGEWRDVGELIKEAQTLSKAGDFDKAIELASTAKFQSERGYEQAMAEKDAGFPQYMYRAIAN